MLKQLLKYEFKATKSLYFGLYLALALLSVVLGVSFRQENAWADNTNFGRLEVILMVLYLSVIFAIAVLCFVSTVQRFYKNLLGREGYLMHTLPVTETQLILSKLITSMVWVLCSGLVGIVCITVMVVVGVFDPETFGMADWDSWKQLWGMLYGELGARFWLVTFWTILINLARLADLILCVYAACMIAHPFRKYGMVSGILAFIGFTLIGHPYAALMAIFTGIMHLVPVVGPWVSAAIATVLGFMFSPMLALWTLVVTMVAQNVTDNVISPKVMQSSVQVHPVMSLTALVIGSALMGPIGMVIAIPLCAALKGIFVYYFENETGRQLVAYDGAVFKGTPYRDAEGNPVAAYDALGDDTFIYESELIGNETAPEAQAMPKPELENPWIKLSGLQPDATGFFKNPFAKDDDSNTDDDTKTGIDGSMDDSDSK